jgi:hypothetical protein
MASPSASVLFVKSTNASIASRTHVRDDREAPLLVARDGRQSAGDFRNGSTADTCDQLARRANHLNVQAMCQGISSFRGDAKHRTRNLLFLATLRRNGFPVCAFRAK